MNKRSTGRQLATVDRRRRIEAMLTRGVETSADIAEQLARDGIEVTDRQVRYDLEAIEAEWRERYTDDRQRRKLRLVRLADGRNDQLRAEWERSKLDKERSRQKEVKPGKGKGESESEAADPGRVETEAAVEGRLGDVAYMREMRENDRFIAELLGLYEPTRHAHGGDPDAPPIQTKGHLEPDVQAVRAFMAAIIGSGTLQAPEHEPGVTPAG